MGVLDSRRQRPSDLRALPGSNVLQQLVNGAAAWALVIALLGRVHRRRAVGGRRPLAQPPLRGARTHGRARLRRRRARGRGRPGTGQLLRAPRDARHDEARSDARGRRSRSGCSAAATQPRSAPGRSPASPLKPLCSAPRAQPSRSRSAARSPTTPLTAGAQLGAGQRRRCGRNRRRRRGRRRRLARPQRLRRLGRGRGASYALNETATLINSTTHPSCRRRGFSASTGAWPASRWCSRCRACSPPPSRR